MNHKLKSEKKEFRIISFYPEFHNGVQLKVILHKDKPHILKTLAKDLKVEIQFELITRALKPIGDLSLWQIERLK